MNYSNDNQYIMEPEDNDINTFYQDAVIDFALWTTELVYAFMGKKRHKKGRNRRKLHSDIAILKFGFNCQFKKIVWVILPFTGPKKVLAMIPASCQWHDLVPLYLMNKPVIKSDQSVVSSFFFLKDAIINNDALNWTLVNSILGRVRYN